MPGPTLACFKQLLCWSVGKAIGDPDLDWLANYGFEVLVEAEVEKATAHQTITLGTGTEFRIGQGDGSAHIKGALPKGTARKYGRQLLLLIIDLL